MIAGRSGRSHHGRRTRRTRRFTTGGGRIPVVLIVVLAQLAIVSCAGAESPVLPRSERTKGLRVATLNIHYLAERSEALVAQWAHRAQAVVSVLGEIDADLVAFQEMETFVGGSFNEENRQMETLGEAFPEFGFAASGDPREYPTTQPVMYRRARLDPIEQGFFFFSPTPDELYSDPWWGRYPSFATWVRFRIRAGDANATILVVNVHIDRERYRNQVRSAELTARRISAIRRTGEPLVVLGDFNSFRFMRPVRIIGEAAQLSVAPGNGSTYHFNRGLRLFPAIDHVLFSEHWTADATQTVRRRPGGVWPSDHFPVVVDLVWSAEDDQSVMKW